MATAYEALTEKEKDSDREQADKVFATLRRWTTHWVKSSEEA
jgi:hypothetical protein